MSQQTRLADLLDRIDRLEAATVDDVRAFARDLAAELVRLLMEPADQLLGSGPQIETLRQRLRILCEHLILREMQAACRDAEKR